MDINNCAALVTGGASGMGATTARALAAAGAKVAVLDRDLAKAQAVADEIGGIAFECDVSDAAAAEAAVSAAQEAHGVARVLVNCAGVGVAGRVVGREGPMPLEDFSRVININLIGTFNLTRLAATAMAAAEPLNEDGARGVIVNTASVAAYEGQVGQSAYSASKGGIVSMTLPIARELAQFGVRVLTIAPGLIKTPMMAGLPEEIQESLGASVPFPKRLGRPEEFSDTVMHIIASDYLNGEVIRLDGAIRLAPR
jgi:NAD(P)-dependent dehydrogenase (short-subunit alcohol dehydrogenase family)